MAIFYNQATLSYSGGVLNSNTAMGEILEVISMEKTAVGGTYSIGDTVTYALSILNSGAAPLSGLSLTDDLGQYTAGGATVYPLTYQEGSLVYFVNGVEQAAAPAVIAGPPLQISGISVPAGGNVILLYKAVVNQFASPAQGGSIQNTATLTGGGLTVPVTATATVTAGNNAQLNIFKSLSPATVVENGTLTYTFLIENTGSAPAVATDDVVVTDLFNPILDPISVTLNGVPLTENVDYTYNPATGLFSTTAGRITVPAATFAQDAATGQWTITPGVTTLVVSGTV